MIVSWAVTVPAVAAIIVGDERRLARAKDPRLGRAWPPSSRDAAIFATWNFGVQPLCLLFHFIRTRRSLGGTLAGLLWLMAVKLLDVGAQLAAAKAVTCFGV
jgi:hypothetical protein